MGALLVAGLFFFREKNTKPINFMKGNQAADQDKTSAVAPSSVVKVQSLPQIQNLSVEDSVKWKTFEEIVKTKNDNDPRMDSQLKKLSPAIHEALFVKYKTVPAEARNERGLIVFLIARDFHSTADMQFLEKVYEESPCLSLSDCQKLSPEDPHHSTMNETTLTYPQQSGLYLIDQQLKEKPQLLSDAAFRSQIIQILIKAENFQVPKIQELARSIRSRYGL